MSASSNYESIPSVPSSQVHHQQNQSATTGNASTGLQSATDSIVNNASAAMSTISNHPATQNAKDSVVNGPVGQAVSNQTAKTSSEFQDLADSRKIPDQPAATGQPLTQYHSMFYRLLSWKNPRATGLTFATCLVLIFTSRYLNILRYTFKGLYTILGITALAELAGKVALGNGFATQLRPRKYYTIRKESLERFLDDVEQLINFAVIEFQRILFVENIWVTSAAFSASFLSYWLIKWLPLWGLTLLATITTYIAPLIYVSNREFIDEHLNNAGHLINAQASQVRDLAAHHTTNAAGSLRNYAGEYSQKAQGLLNSTREKVNGSTQSGIGSTHSGVGSTQSGVGSTHSGVGSTQSRVGSTQSGVQKTDFPSAPHSEPAAANGRTTERQQGYESRFAPESQQGYESRFAPEPQQAL